MRYGVLREIQLRTLDIGLESFILGPVVVNKMKRPLGDTALKTRAVFSSYRVLKYSIEFV